MTTVDYKPFVDRMIHRYEGGYGWDRGDPGGPTNWGVTCYDLAEERHQKMNSMSAWAPLVKAMPLSEAESIYATKYATATAFDALNPGKDCVLFDYGVNSGTGRANRVARAVVGFPSGTTMTPSLVDAINSYPADKFIDVVCDERLSFMHQIRGGAAWAEFGHGWGVRVTDLRAYCHSLIKGAPAPTAPDLSKVPTPKAQHTDPQAPKKTTTAAGGTVAAGGGSAAVGAPWWVPAGIAIAGLGVAGYMFYRHLQNQKADATVTLPYGALNVGSFGKVP